MIVLAAPIESTAVHDPRWLAVVALYVLLFLFTLPNAQQLNGYLKLGLVDPAMRRLLHRLRFAGLACAVGAVAFAGCYVWSRAFDNWYWLLPAATYFVINPYLRAAVTERDEAKKRLASRPRDRPDL